MTSNHPAPATWLRTTLLAFPLLLPSGASAIDLWTGEEYAEALGKIQTEDSPVVPLLVEALDDGDPRIQNWALVMVHEMGPSASGVLPLIVDRLREPAHSSFAGMALDSLGREATPYLLQMLYDPEPGVRRRSITILASMGEDAAWAIPDLMECLRDSAVADSASYALGRIGEGAIPSLVQALADEAIQEEAARALGWIGEAALPALEEALGDKNPSLREGAVIALQWMSEERAREALPAVIELLGDEEPRVRRAALETLQDWLVTDDAGLVQQLVGLLEDEDPDVRVGAAACIAEIGPGAEKAVPPLVKLLQSADEAVRQEAAQALGAIGPSAKSAVPALVEMLGAGEEKDRVAAAEALGGIGPDARAAIPALVKGFQEAGKKVREQVAEEVKKEEERRNAVISDGPKPEDRE